MEKIPRSFPLNGLDEADVFEWFRHQIENQSALLGSADAFAHMDPPTPDIASSLVGINARFNQNLLHPDLYPISACKDHAEHRQSRCLLR